MIRKQGRQSRPLASLLAGGLAFAALGAADAQGESQQQADAASTLSAEPQPRHPREMTYLKRKWGVEILFVRQSSAGYMLEFRYKVLDPEKAQTLSVRQTKPVLTHAKTGAKLIVPTPAKTGALRNSNTPLADHTYWMFFANPGKLVEQGDAVSIDIGEFHVEGLIVE